MASHDAILSEKERIRNILRLRKVGYDRIRTYDLEEARRATIADRLKELDALVQFARDLRIEPTSTEVTDIWKRWDRIRKAHERA